MPGRSLSKLGHVTPGTKVVEISHGSDYSRVSSRTPTPEISKTKYRWGVAAVVITIVLVILILTPLFWYDNVAKVSTYLKKYKLYRTPVMIAISIISFIILICTLCIVFKRHKRKENGKAIAKYREEENIVNKDTLTVAADEGMLSHPASPKALLRRKLEDLPTQTIQEIKDVLMSHCKERGYDTSRRRNWPAEQSIDPFHYHCWPEYILNLDDTFTDNEDENSDVSDSFVNFSVSCHNVRLNAFLFGEVGVGKTSLFHRILYDQYPTSYVPTLGRENGVWNVCYSDKENDKEVACSVHISDMGGGLPGADLFTFFVQDIVLFIGVCNATSSNVKELTGWIRALRMKVLDPNIVILLTKTDLPNIALTKNKLRALPGYYPLHIYEVSAKTGEGVTEAFEAAVAVSLLKEIESLNAS